MTTPKIDPRIIELHSRSITHATQILLCSRSEAQAMFLALSVENIDDPEITPPLVMQKTNPIPKRAESEFQTSNRHQIHALDRTSYEAQ